MPESSTVLYFKIFGDRESEILHRLSAQYGDETVSSECVCMIGAASFPKTVSTLLTDHISEQNQGAESWVSTDHLQNCNLTS